MNYEQRLKAAAHLILSKDAMVDAHPPFNSEEVGVQAVLKPHQIDGVSWLIRRYVAGVNVILGDEMGLGKTLQAVSFLSYLKVHQMSPGPFLVLCPLSVTDGWMSEFTKFCPSLKVLRYVGDKSSRRELRRTIYEHVKQQSPSPNLGLPFDVLLTTYDIALLDQDFLSQFPWHYTVIDEAQRIKNPSSVLYQTLEQSFVMPRRLLMTGTPIQNNLGELWALMHFCMPMVFGTLEQFLSTFKESGNLSSGCEAAKIKENLKVLKYIMSAFMLRRTKSMLIESGTLTLPRLTEITVMAPLVPLQKKVYLSILKKELPQLLAVSTGASSHQSLQNIVIQLRKACSHPYLFNGIEPEPYEEGEHLVQASGKLTILDKLLQTLHSSGHRVLVFAQMTHTLDILQDFLELRGYMYDRLDGSIRAEERFAAIRSFSQKPSEGFNQEHAFVFLISTRAGGVGLNLVAADTVIFYEQDWNPQVDKQALQRTHRIGQTNHVLSINLVTPETVEEVIMRRAERKLQLSHNVIGKDDNTHQRNKELLAETGDLRSIIFGLHKFDPTDSIGGDTSGMDMEKLKAMSEKVVEMRDHEPSEMDDRKFEINPSDLSHGDNLSVRQRDLSKFDIGLDEASYMSWVEKFKEASKSIESGTPELGRKRKPTESTPLKSKVDSSKAEEKKLAKWETLGYQSLAVKHPIFVPDNDIMSESGSVQFVYGDCTKPYNICPSEPTVIFSCVDNCGNWGHGGMFDALENLSGRISEAYERASECGDLHLGDLHFIKVKGGGNIENNLENAPQWVALAVVQSYNPRRKVPRSSISIPDLEQCLLKASFSAAQNSASIHMPRIGYQNGTDRSEWYTVERILQKYASTYGIKIFVYYYRRADGQSRC